MDIFVNDFSLACDIPLQAHWDAISKFGSLARNLKEYGVDKIVFPGGYKHMVIGGIQWKECYLPHSTSLKDDQRLELLSIMNGIIKEARASDYDSTHQFSENTLFSITSSLLACSYIQDSPVASFTFDDTYKVNHISGYYRKSTQGRHHAVKIRNLYDIEALNPVSIISFKDCKKRHPQKEPMWNHEYVQRYLKNIGYKGNETFVTIEEKQAYLILHGTAIAHMNGWKEDTAKTKKNSTPRKLRKVFYSDKFKHTDFYLCIDVEHADIRFELCNHRGIHLGEVKHTGEFTSGPQSDHNIII